MSVDGANEIETPLCRLIVC